MAVIDKIKEFNALLIESISEVLDFSQVIFRFLELNTPFKKNEIIDKPEIFSNELRDLFGTSGVIIEEIIIRRLCSKIDMKYENRPDLKFEDYIKNALTDYLER